MRIDALDAARRLLGSRFEELAGAHVSGQIPVSERVINRLVAERLAAREGAIETAAVTVRGTGEIGVRLQLRRPSFAPPLTVTARVERQPEFPGSPVLVLRWALARMGILTAFAGPALALFNALPPGIRVEGDLVFVDLARLLEDNGAGEILDHLTTLRVDARDGALLVGFELRAKGA